MARYKYVGPADSTHRRCDRCKASDIDVNRVVDTEDGNKEVTICAPCTEEVPGQPKPLW